jgi:hypothetical protein
MTYKIWGGNKTHTHRNRLGQQLVERLVRTHTNLKFEQRLELYETGLLPWDIDWCDTEGIRLYFFLLYF